MSVKSFINFETFISTNEIFLNIHYFLSFTIFFDLEEINFETYNISENNIISVKLAKVLLTAAQQVVKSIGLASTPNMSVTNEKHELIALVPPCMK